MIAVELIEEIVKEKAAMVKKAKGVPIFDGSNDYKKLPEFYETYRESVENYDRIKVHAIEGTFPYKLFADKAPNQKPTEWEYQKRLYKAIGSPTFPFWAKAMAAISRIWNEKNFTIRYPEVTGVEYTNEQPQKYFEQDYPEFKSIEAYFKSIVTTQKINDPNAWLAVDVVPSDTDTELLKPFAVIYNCKNVWGMHPGKWLLVKTEEKSYVKYGGRSVKEGIVLKLYAPEGVYTIKQTGLKTDYIFAEPELYAWPTPFTELPAWPLKGTPVTEDNKVYYQSYFMPAVSNLNGALIDGFTLAVSKVIGAFPERWERVDDCNAEGCNGTGSIWDSERQRDMRCGTCHGTGIRNYTSVLGVTQIPVEKEGGLLTPKNLEPPFAGYTEKSEVVDMCKFLSTEFDKQVNNAFAMVNIEVSPTQVKGSDTALGKQIDREEFFSFLLQISNELFDLLQNTINAIGFIRYGAGWGEGVKIGYPQNFAIRSEEEITEEIGKAKETGQASIIVETLMRNYAGIRFNSDDSINKKLDLIFAVDRLFSYNSQEVSIKLLSGIVGKWEAILHDSIGTFIDEALNEDENFFELELPQQHEILYKKAQDKAELISPPAINMTKIVEEV